jgi:CheY-like chemotaxis protein
VCLPCTTEKLAKREGISNVALKAQPGEVVVVLEDEPSVRKLTSKMLQMLGYKVLEASSAEQCLAYIRQEPRVDLLLSDVVMPGMSGCEVRDLANAIRPELKTLFMSGYSEELISHQGVLEPGIHFIRKPFGAVDLGHKVREAIGG